MCMEVSEAYHMGTGTQSMEHCINSTDGRIGSAVFTEYDFGLMRSDSHSAFEFRVDCSIRRTSPQGGLELDHHLRIA